MCVCVCVCIYIYIYNTTSIQNYLQYWKKRKVSSISMFKFEIYVVPSISFQTFLYRHLEWWQTLEKFSMLLLYVLSDDWPIFMIYVSNEQLQQQLKYTILKPDYHSRWISKMQSGREEWRYAIKLSFKRGKNATETYGMLQTAFRASCMNQPSVFEWHKGFEEGRVCVRGD